MTINRRALIGSAAALGASSAFAAGDEGSNAAQKGSDIVVDGCSPALPTLEYLELLRKGGVDCWNLSMMTGLAQMSFIHEFLASNSSDVELAKSAEDIRRIKREGKISLTIGWQAADAFSDPDESSWWTEPPRTALRAYYVLGLRVVGLVYNLTNEFAGGCLDPHIGLSKAGRRMVAELQKIGVLVDCGGHTGERSSLDIIEMAERPVVCTHSNIFSLNPNPRNTSDRVIEGIAKTGGLFGVSAIGPFMSWGPDDVGVRTEPNKRADVKRYVDELDYLKKLVGVDHIGIGGDFTTGAESVIDPATSFAFPPEMTYVQNPIEYAKGFENISKLPNVRDEMVRRGWQADEISKVMGENWMRVYAAAWN